MKRLEKISNCCMKDSNSLNCSRMLLSLPTVCQAAGAGFCGRGSSKAPKSCSKQHQAFLAYIALKSL